ncbi:pantoate--beta-alanine ligase [Crossiella sp. CA-258035]|uniref:pantoate--beta-alanine ligase n=1 Tax=Crossiella sp. CA-258035 TaxID=2981138 RepID=UPI0024BC1A9D|nr:pantoate--beta-alanine ligase [Crossiella sp. CA-258035]WHT19841.1 pantoate--beta-alanine ligase [Crossiella sp. CA-258035]
MTGQRPFTPGELTVHHSPEELGKVTRALRATGRKVNLVPTMGALHEGHRALIRRARRIPGTVTAVSIFVNPLQFGPEEDFHRYPRPLEADLDACREEGVDLVFNPAPEAMYGTGAGVTVHPGPLGAELEGAVRPGHFAGVLTVVAKLLNIVRPDYAFFGEKDYQQFVLVKRMVADLNLESAIVGVPIVRDHDGLALSSRNAYLSEDERRAALAIPAALAAGAMAGPEGPAAILAAARAAVEAESGLSLDYLELRSRDLGPAPENGKARLLIAARAGRTRLLDNIQLAVGHGVDEHDDTYNPAAGLPARER